MAVNIQSIPDLYEVTYSSHLHISSIVFRCKEIKCNCIKCKHFVPCGHFQQTFTNQKQDTKSGSNQFGITLLHNKLRVGSYAQTILLPNGVTAIGQVNHCVKSQQRASFTYTCIHRKGTIDSSCCITLGSQMCFLYFVPNE